MALLPLARKCRSRGFILMESPSYILASFFRSPRVTSWFPCTPPYIIELPTLHLKSIQTSFELAWMTLEEVQTLQSPPHYLFRPHPFPCYMVFSHPNCHGHLLLHARRFRQSNSALAFLVHPAHNRQQVHLRRSTKVLQACYWRLGIHSALASWGIHLPYSGDEE